MPVVNPKVGKMRTITQRYQKLLIMIEWFSSDLKAYYILPWLMYAMHTMHVWLPIPVTEPSIGVSN